MSLDELEARIAELREKEQLAAIRPDLDGHAVMAQLGIPPGPLVGRALSYLLERRLDDGPHTEEEAKALLDAWWAEQPESGKGTGSDELAGETG